MGSKGRFARRWGAEVLRTSRARATFNPSCNAVQVERGHRELQLVFVERMAEALAEALEPRGVDPLVVARMQLEERPGALTVSSQ
jgi:hypothetical protein